MTIPIISSMSPYVYKAKRVVVNNVKMVKNDVKDTAMYLGNNAKVGWRAGRIHSKQHKKCQFNAFWTKLWGATKNTKVRAKDLPAIMGGAGIVCIPLPGGEMIGYGLGKGINALMKCLRLK